MRAGVRRDGGNCRRVVIRRLFDDGRRRKAVRLVSGTIERTSKLRHDQQVPDVVIVVAVTKTNICLGAARGEHMQRGHEQLRLRDQAPQPVTPGCEPAHAELFKQYHL